MASIMVLLQRGGWMNAKKYWLTSVVALALAIMVAYALWQQRGSSDLGPGFVAGNGRVEATEIDVATRFAGRVRSISVRQGDNVAEGQDVAQMDTDALQAQRREAQAQQRRAQYAHATASAVVLQREQARKTALAIVAQRASELDYAQKQWQRSRQLVERGFIAAQKLDIDRNLQQGALAQLAAAQSQVIEADAAILAAQSQVIEAESGIEAAGATLERLQVELDDAVLKAARSGRIQYRLVEPGEVIAAGARVATLIDLSDVTMTLFLPEITAGKVALGSEARLVLDAMPQYVIPARVAHVAAEAQFTPKTVETASERQKLVFQVKLQLDQAWLRQHASLVKSGLPGVATIRLDPALAWPPQLQTRLPSSAPSP
jgi:HlyD family secretion protein